MEECIFDKKILVSHTLQSYRCFKRLKCCKDLWFYDRKWHLNVFREGGGGLKGVLGLFSYYEENRAINQLNRSSSINYSANN